MGATTVPLMFRHLWLLLGALSSASAFADAYDFRIYQLGNPQCIDRGTDGTCLLGATGYTPSANAHFRSFIRRLGGLMTSVNLAPPETLGHAGFAVSAELTGVDFKGATDPNEIPTQKLVDGAVLMPSIHLRKGLPWSFEVGARASWLEQSRMSIGTIELKWAVLEGFDYLPAIAIRGHLSKMLNTRDFDIAAGGLDLGMGKQFAIAGMATFTPYVGWNLVFVGASTGTIDFNPHRSLSAGDRPTAPSQDYYVFDPVSAASNANNRFYAGFRFIAGVLMLGYEFSYTVLGSFNDDTVGLVNAGTVQTNSGTIGFDF